MFIIDELSRYRIYLEYLCITLHEKLGHKQGGKIGNLGNMRLRSSSVFLCSNTSCCVRSETTSSKLSAYRSILSIIWSTRFTCL